MRAFFSVLTLLVVLAALCSTVEAQKKRKAQGGGSGIGAMASKLGISPECITFIKQILFDGGEFSIAKLANIATKIPTLAMQLLMPNPCTEIVSKMMAKLQDYGINLGGFSK